MAFELGFGGKDGTLPAVTISRPDGELRVGGKVDRVDGWIKDDKLYLRVVDYKSGKKKFDLANVRMDWIFRCCCTSLPCKRRERNILEKRSNRRACCICWPTPPRRPPPAEKAARSVEYQLDGLVLVPNCDKIVPGMVMAAVRMDVPAVVCSGGPMLAGRYGGEEVSLSKCSRLSARTRPV